jgi:hypothetical protein
MALADFWRGWAETNGVIDPQMQQDLATMWRGDILAVELLDGRRAPVASSRRGRY